MCGKQALFIASAVLSFIAFIFILIGAAGHGDDEATVTSIPWGYGNYEGFIEGNFFLGLQGVFLKTDGFEGEYTSYDDSSCNVDFCDACEDAGATIVAMCVLALLLAAATIGLNTWGAMSESKVASIGSTICAVVAAVLALVGFIVFRPCIQDVVDDLAVLVVGESSGNYSTAAILTLIGFIIMLISTILSGISLCVGNDEAASNDNNNSL